MMRTESLGGKTSRAAGAGASGQASRARSIRQLLPVVVAVLAGVLLWYAIRASQSLARPLLGRVPEWLSLVVNAGLEEGFRLSLALTIARAIKRLDLDPGLASLGVVSASTLGTLENWGYLAAFPTLDIYWRLGYALPVHAGAAALYAIALAPAEAGVAGVAATSGAAGVAGSAAVAGTSGATRRRVVPAAFAAAWVWHSTFNCAAALFPFPALPVLGTVLNTLALSALVVASALRFGYWSIYAAR